MTHNNEVSVEQCKGTKGTVVSGMNLQSGEQTAKTALREFDSQLDKTLPTFKANSLSPFE